MKVTVRVYIFAITLATSFVLAQNALSAGYYTGIPRLDALLSNSSYDSGVPSGNVVTGSASGRFVFKIVVRRETNNPEIMECEAWIFHQNSDSGISYYEKARSSVVWQGNNGTCTINLIYDWKRADINGQVELGTSIMAQTPCECRDKNINRSSSHDLPAMRLPANATWTTINENYRI